MSERSKHRIPRPLLVVLGAAPALAAVAMFVFFVRSELAHDEATCPYARVETRELSAEVSVREDARVCQPEVEERRWVVLRDGRELELGRRRLEAAMYAEGYSWQASVEEGRVRLEIDNPGLPSRLYREPPPDAGLR